MCRENGRFTRAPLTDVERARRALPFPAAVDAPPMRDIMRRPALPRMLRVMASMLAALERSTSSPVMAAADRCAADADLPAGAVASGGGCDGVGSTLVTSSA